MTNLALAASRRGGIRRSRTLFARARRLFAHERNDVWLALVDFYEALVLYRDGQAHPARELAAHARRLFARASGTGQGGSLRTARGAPRPARRPSARRRGGMPRGGRTIECVGNAAARLPVAVPARPHPRGEGRSRCRARRVPSRVPRARAAAEPPAGRQPQDCVLRGQTGRVRESRCRIGDEHADAPPDGRGLRLHRAREITEPRRPDRVPRGVALAAHGRRNHRRAGHAAGAQLALPSTGRRGGQPAERRDAARGRPAAPHARAGKTAGEIARRPPPHRRRVRDAAERRHVRRRRDPRKPRDRRGAPRVPTRPADNCTSACSGRKISTSCRSDRSSGCGA